MLKIKDDFLLKKIINKLRYKYYSQYYVKDISKNYITAIKNLSKSSQIFIARQNGKSFLTIKYQYIYYVENYKFKEAKIILKFYKKYLKK